MTLTRAFNLLLAIAGLAALTGTLAAADWQALANLDKGHAQDLYLPVTVTATPSPAPALPLSLELPQPGPLARTLLGSPTRYVF